MRKSIFITDMYHVLQYALYVHTNREWTSKFLKTTEAKEFLYPSKITYFGKTDDIENQVKNTSSPAYFLELFRKAVRNTGASKIHIFATLKEANKEYSTTIANMKTIAYANKLRYPEQAK